MDMRSPLSRAQGLGSAKDGTHHFWVQRLTAIALIPLTIWFVFNIVCLSSGDFADVTAWLSKPLVTVLMVLFVATGFYHSALGVQVVIEDYVGGEGKKITSLIVSKFLHFAFGLAGVIAILRIAFS